MTKEMRANSIKSQNKEYTKKNSTLLLQCTTAKKKSRQIKRKKRTIREIVFVNVWYEVLSHTHPHTHIYKCYPASSQVRLFIPVRNDNNLQFDCACMCVRYKNRKPMRGFYAATILLYIKYTELYIYYS